MSTGYRPSCDACGWVGHVAKTEQGALDETAVHICYPHRCGLCGIRVPVLVDDGPLCIRCDLIIYPGEAA